MTNKLKKVYIGLAVLIFLVVSVCAALLGATGKTAGLSRSETHIPLFETEGTGSPVNYVENEYTGGYEYEFTLTAQDVFKYNEPIDFTSLTSKDPFFTFRVNAREKGVTDIKILRIELTDVYDPENVVVITGTYNNSEYIYWKVGFKGDSLVGQHWSTVYVNDRWGMPWTTPSFSVQKDSQSGVGRLAFDAASGNMFINDQRIFSLYDDEYYNTGWQGFTTGDAYLSIRVEEFIGGAESANLAVIGVAGKEFNGETEAEIQPPKILVDYGGYGADNYPKGRYGLYYPVFDATTYSTVSGIYKPEVKIFADYYGTKREKEGVNGKILIDEITVYTIEYTASDDLGLTSLVTVDIVVTSDYDQIVPVVKKQGDLTGVVGKKAVIAEVDFENANGLKKVYSVKDPHGRFIELKTREFVPETAGTYNVSCSVTDDFYGAAHVYSYDVSVTLSDKPVINIAGDLPEYAIIDAKYAIPEIDAYDYGTGEEAEVTLSGDGVAAEGGALVFSGEDGETVQLKITAACGDNVTEETREVILVSASTDVAGQTDMSAYFVSDNASAALANGEVRIFADGGGETLFINKLLANGFVSDLKADGTESFSLRLKDGIYKENEIVFSFIKSGLSYDVYINDVPTGTSVKADGYFNFGVGTDGKTFSVGGNTCSVTEFKNGFDFEGFSGGLFYMSFVLPSGGALCIKTLMNQNFGAETLVDIKKPVISLLGNYGGSYAVGDEYVVAAAAAWDCLQVRTTLTVTVLSPSGEYVTAKDGTVLNAVSADREYVITIEELGLYNFTYYAETDSPNARAKDETVAYSLNILDTVCPEIRFADEGKTLTVKPGEKIVFGGLSVTDNDTAAEDIEILYFVLTPNGSVVMPGSNEFSAERAGLYTVYIKAADSYGNSDIVYCYLEIK